MWPPFRISPTCLHAFNKLWRTQCLDSLIGFALLDNVFVAIKPSRLLRRHTWSQLDVRDKRWIYPRAWLLSRHFADRLMTLCLSLRRLPLHLDPLKVTSLFTPIYQVVGTVTITTTNANGEVTSFPSVVPINPNVDTGLSRGDKIALGCGIGMAFLQHLQLSGCVCFRS